MCVAVSLGEHQASMIRLSDGWSFAAQGLQQYEDGTVEWNFSTGGAFREDDLDRCRKLLRANDPDMKKYFDYLDHLRDSGVTFLLHFVILLLIFLKIFPPGIRPRTVLGLGGCFPAFFLGGLRKRSRYEEIL